jgi:hypothetical protein
MIWEDDVVPVEQWEGKFEYGLSCIHEQVPAGHPFLYSLYATNDMGLPFASQRPFCIPADIQDWGQQGMYYPPSMIQIAICLIRAFLLTPLRPIPGSETGWDGFDFVLYKGARLLRIPIYYWALVQHDHKVRSVAKCPTHTSPLLHAVLKRDTAGLE